MPNSEPLQEFWSSPNRSIHIGNLEKEMLGLREELKSAKHRINTLRCALIDAQSIIGNALEKDGTNPVSFQDPST